MSADDRLNTADIILLLISADAIADPTCYDLEINQAMQYHQAGEARLICTEKNETRTKRAIE